MIVFSDPPYAALPRENLLARIVGLGPEVTVVEDLFYALLWIKLDEQGTLPYYHELYNIDGVEYLVIERVKVVKG